MGGVIEKGFAIEQARRLYVLDCFVPQEHRQKAFDELVLAIEAAGSTTIAMYVVSEWLSDQREWPKPVDLRRLIWEENEKRDVEIQKAKLSCARCYGSGHYFCWQDLERKFCKCAAGSELLASDPNLVREINRAQDKLEAEAATERRNRLKRRPGTVYQGYM